MKFDRLFFLKFSEIFCLILVIIGLTQIFDNASEWQFKIVDDWSNTFLSLAIITTLSLIIAFFWQKSGKYGHLHGYFQTIIAFYLAYSITTYGSAKILKTQFQPPNYIYETPIGDLPGFWLTWTYFGFSQTMAAILGWTQVIGSILLLFRRFRLLGAFILLPVMVNIDLIDHFYDISPLAYYNALHYTLLLIFLILLEYETLKTVFFKYKLNFKFNKKTILLNTLRILAIAGAFYKVNELKNGFEPKTKLNGVWQINSIKTNQKTQFPQACQDSVWSKIYFEWRYGCLIKYHADKFQDKDLRGSYKIDTVKKMVSLNLQKDGKDEENAFVLGYDLKTDSTAILNGIYKKDTLVLNLKKLK